MKKIIGLIIGAVLLVSITATSVYAGVSHYYSDLLTAQKGQMEDEIYKEYQVMEQHYGEVVHNDLVMYVEGKRVEVLTTAKDYLHESLASDASGRFDEHILLIDESAETLKNELIEYINQLKGE